MKSFLAFLQAKFEPIYIFTVLAALYAVTLTAITHAELKDTAAAVMQTALGGVLALLGTVVQSVFGKDRNNATRGSDSGNPAATGVVSDPAIQGAKS